MKSPFNKKGFIRRRVWKTPAGVWAAEQYVYNAVTGYDTKKEALKILISMSSLPAFILKDKLHLRKKRRWARTKTY